MDQLQQFERPALPPGHEALIVAGAASARERGTVWVEGRGAARSDRLRLRAAPARDPLFLARSRCDSGGCQNNSGGGRKTRPGLPCPPLVALGPLLRPL